MKAVIEKKAAQKKLVVTWLISSLLVSLFFVLVSWSRTTADGFNESVQWLFNYLSPGFTLIIGSFAYAASQPDSAPDKFINSSYLAITFWFSVTYLASIAAIAACTVFAIGDSMTLMDYLKKFNIILSFLQTGLLVLLGIFFTKENQAASKVKQG